MWPKVEDDYMEIGNSNWVIVGEGLYLNKLNNHIIDECGIEYDAEGNIVYSPTEEEE